MMNRIFDNSGYNTHGCTMSVTVDSTGVVVASTGCSHSLHGTECLVDGWADGMLIEVTGPEPETGDWEIIDRFNLNDPED